MATPLFHGAKIYLKFYSKESQIEDFKNIGGNPLALNTSKSILQAI
jgi:hypothetical protein